MINGRKRMTGKRVCFFASLCLVFFFLYVSVSAYYWPPDHVPPNPPPNYAQIDTIHFLGAPPLPYPPPDSGGIYIWYDQGLWNIANHIYSVGRSFEQFHCCILVCMAQPPTPGLNVFAEEFELWAGANKNRCLKQNDRWGWKPWGDNLYEIWWDVTTRDWKPPEGDPNDFMRITIAGSAVDFNLWSSGHSSSFDANQVFLGASKIPLSGIAEYYDYFEGISDPYQSQAGTNPTGDPNVTIFTKYSDSLRAFNQNGLIDSADSYICDLAVNYGQRYAGTFAYEGNGVQFSTNGVCGISNPPWIQLPPDTSIFVCADDSFCIDILASDPDPGDSITVEKIFGAGTYTTVTDTAPIFDIHCFLPDTSGSYMLIFKVTDKGGLFDMDTSIVNVDVNDPPVLSLPVDTIYHFCSPDSVCRAGISATDTDISDTITIEKSSGPGIYNPLTGEVCFLPEDTDSTYKFVFSVTDSCGEADVDSFYVTVDLNQAPEITSGDTVKYNLCDTSTVCFDVTLYDPDDGLIISVNPPGQYNPSDSSICFFADRDTTYDFTIIVTDTCGASGTAYTTAVVQVNQPPVVSAPDTVTHNLCDTATVCFDITLYDPDDSLNVSVNPPGQYNPSDSSICFFADRDTTYDFTIIVTDTCGASDTAYTTAVVQVNQPPVVTAPAQVEYNLCDTATVCFDVTLDDPDDGLTVWVNSPGQFNLSDSSICFFANKDTTYNFTIIATDSCGKSDTAYTVAVVGFNYPPQLTVPNDLDTSLCEVQEICIAGIVATDLDPEDTITLEKTKGPGVFNPITGLSPLSAQVCFTPAGGQSTYEFTFRVTDLCGLFDEESFKVTVSVNRPPVVTAQTSRDTVDLCPDALYRLNVQADDPDRDYDISLQKKQGPGTFASVSGKPSLSGLYDWTPAPADTIEIHQVVFEVVDHCGLRDEDTVWLRVRTPHECECLVDVYIDSVKCAFPGAVAEVSVNIFSSLDIGGFKLYIGFDPTTMTFLDVERGDLIDDFEGYYDEYGHSPRYLFQYFNSRILPCGFPCESHQIKIVGIADMPDNWINGPLPAGQGELMKLRFKVAKDANLQDLFLPIRFEFNYEFDYVSNSFSSATGESLYVDIEWPGETSEPNHNILRWACFTNGGVKVCSDAFSWVGDINLNEYPYEIADAVLFSNYFMHGLGVFQIDPDLQILSTDVNRDGFTLSVSDFVFLIRIILEDVSPKSKLAPSSDLANVTLVTQGDGVTVVSNSNAAVGAGLYVFRHSGEVKNLTLHTNMDVKYHDENGELRVLIYSFEGKSIPAGTVDLFSFEAADVQLAEVEAADFYGSPLTSTVSARTVPTSFALMNNYPNPFNLYTNIRFALPVDARVSLKLYNVAGQMVKSFEDHYEAGTHTITWDATNDRGETVASGIYFYRLVARNYSSTRKMVLMK